ncbi:UNVERIFIED_CONTAM: hypothetical protein FKN15_053401 [Acipenser sinensis]
MLQSSTPRWRMSNFHPCTSCMRKLPLQDKHTLYVKCLSTELASDALADRSSCPICARSKEKTLESRMVHYSGEPRRAVIGLGIPGLPSPPFKPYAKYSLCTGSTALQQSLKICLEGQKESEKHGPGKGHRRVKGLNGPDTRALKQAAGTPAPAPAPPAPAPQHTPASPVITAEVQQQDLVMIEEEQDALSIAASRDEESFLQAESQDLDLTQSYTPRCPSCPSLGTSVSRHPQCLEYSTPRRFDALEAFDLGGLGAPALHSLGTSVPRHPWYLEDHTPQHFNALTLLSLVPLYPRDPQSFDACSVSPSTLNPLWAFRCLGDL